MLLVLLLHVLLCTYSNVPRHDLDLQDNNRAYRACAQTSLNVSGPGQQSVKQILGAPVGLPKWLRPVDIDTFKHTVKPDAPLPFNCTKSKSTPGFRICVHSKERDKYISAALLSSGVWEPFVTRVYQQALVLHPDAAVVDIGANIGYYTLLAAAMGHSVVAVEPQLENLKRLAEAARSTTPKYYGAGASSVEDLSTVAARSRLSFSSVRDWKGKNGEPSTNLDFTRIRLTTPSSGKDQKAENSDPSDNTDVTTIRVATINPRKRRTRRNNEASISKIPIARSGSGEGKYNDESLSDQNIAILNSGKDQKRLNNEDSVPNGPFITNPISEKNPETSTSNKHIKPRTRSILLLANAVSDGHRNVSLTTSPDNQGGVRVVEDCGPTGWFLARLLGLGQWYRRGRNHGTNKVGGSQQDCSVSTITMDDLLRVLPASKVVIKVDIEGYECRALATARRFFSAVQVPYIFMEWRQMRERQHERDTHCTPAQVRALAQFLASLGYVPHEVRSGVALNPARATGWVVGDIYWRGP
ncbi:hypothetical protein EGW08_022444, partial [Elysia chlorotica]